MQRSCEIKFVFPSRPTTYGTDKALSGSISVSLSSQCAALKKIQYIARGNFSWRSLRASSTLLFFIFGSICYYRHFDTTLKSHPKVSQEPGSTRDRRVYAYPVHWKYPHGSDICGPNPRIPKLYGSPEEGPGCCYKATQFLFFLVFSDTLMYWLHRLFHLPLLFNTMHRGHHRFIYPTRFRPTHSIPSKLT